MGCYYLQFKLWQSGKASLRRWHLSQDLKGVRKSALRISVRNAFQVMKVKVAQSCPTLCHTITIPSMEFSRPEYRSGYSFPSPGYLPNPGIKPRSPALQADSLPAELQGKPKNTGVGSLPLFQGIFPTKESSRGLLHCRQILYQLSYGGRRANAKILSQE